MKMLVIQLYLTLCNTVDCVAHQASLSMGFSSQEYWSGQPSPSPGDLSNLGSNLGLLHCRQILCPLSYQGSPKILSIEIQLSLSTKPRAGSQKLFLACEVKMKVTQLCPTLWDPMNYTVHGIIQARILV